MKELDQQINKIDHANEMLEKEKDKQEEKRVEIPIENEQIREKKEDEPFSEEEIRVRSELAVFSRDFCRRWREATDPSSAIVGLTKNRYVKVVEGASNTIVSMCNAAIQMNHFGRSFNEFNRTSSTADAIDMVMDLYLTADMYYDAHRGTQYFSESKARKDKAELFMKQGEMFLKGVTDSKTEEDIKGLGAYDVPTKKDKKKIIDEMDDAKDAIIGFCKSIAASSAGMSSEEILREKLTLYRTYDRQIRLYRAAVPEKERTHRKQQVINEYENLLRMEKLLEYRNSLNSKHKNVTVGEMVKKQVEEEDDRKIEEFSKKENIDDGLTNEQLKGIEEIDQWLIRNARNGGLGGAVISSLKNPHGDFVSAILSRSKRERLHMYYLVESNMRKSPSHFDVGLSQEMYVPNLEAFKDRMVATKWKFYTRFTGRYTYMNKLSEAFQITMEYRDEIRTTAMLQQGKFDKVEEKKDMSPEEALYHERLNAYRNFYNKLYEYKAFLVSADKAKGSVKARMETEAKELATNTEEELKKFLKKDNDYIKRGQLLLERDKEAQEEVTNRYYNDVIEANEFTSKNATFGSVPSMVNSAMNATRKERFGILGWSWGMEDKTWEDFHLWSGSIANSIGMVGGVMSAVASGIAVANCHQDMTKEEIAEKLLSVAKFTADALRSGFSFVENIYNAGKYFEKASTAVQAVSAASAVLDVGVAVAKTTAVVKQCKHSKNAKEYFEAKHEQEEGKELTREQKRKSKFEKNILKLSDKIISKDKTAAIYQGVKAGLGILSVTVPVVGTVFAVVKGIVGVVASIHDLVKLTDLRQGMFDNYFNIEELTDQVFKEKRKNNITSRNHIFDSYDQLQAALRKRVAAAAGFCDMRAAADFIAGKFSRFMHNALFGDNPVQGDEKNGYVELLKSFNLPYDEKKKSPSQRAIFRKMTCS